MPASRHTVQVVPGHPPGYRDRGVPADPFEAVLNQRIDLVARSGGPRDRQAEHILGPRLQRLAETAQTLPLLPHLSGRRHWD